ncbi:hypothetical protein [Paramaledivibacter caminithermalis]|jgi:hypothetical protein|uniref:Uncharacterized protein n=1 Tax=Paramaledivibacter caminithermalis (strain DSM 15212 / CIP 107654 / DViRD3) TaxID=1121301 RepID=A0A1M6KFC6_PARC5|nr:hypothetical protein [Paramaledivibacter caminithermalis]SHJ57600.1 hypothetical protein SAMN02745912_00370 [Paramaledivibacter caminithermalis DSM 15212]
MLKILRKITPIFMAIVLVMSLSLTSFAYEYDGEDKQGVQIDDKFYSLDYILTHISEFGSIIANAGLDIILDVNGKSANLAAYFASGTEDDFDTWSSNPENQTEPNPSIYINQSGEEILINGNQEDDTKIENAVAKNAVFLTIISGECASDVTKVEVVYDGKTKEAVMDNGTFTYNVVPMMQNGDEIVVKAYVGDELVDTDLIVVGEEVQEKEFKVIDIY